MAKVIEFYVPNNFRKALKWVPEVQRGKMLEFCPSDKEICLGLCFLEDCHEFH